MNEHARITATVSALSRIPEWTPDSVSATVGSSLAMARGQSEFAGVSELSAPLLEPWQRIDLRVPHMDSRARYVIIELITSPTVPPRMPSEAVAALSPILSDAHGPDIPLGQANENTKRQWRRARIAHTEISFAFEGADFVGPQVLRKVLLKRETLEVCAIAHREQVARRMVGAP